MCIKSTLWVSVQFKTLSLILCNLFYAPCTENQTAASPHQASAKYKMCVSVYALLLFSISEFHTLAEKVTQTFNLFELVILN